jgi:PAS domain S-box-containing protein
MFSAFSAMRLLPRNGVRPVISLTLELIPNSVMYAPRFEYEILQKVFDHVPIMINLLDQSGRVKLVNRHWENVLGWSLSEAQETDVISAAYPNPADHQEVLQLLASPSTHWRDFRTCVRDGRVIETSWLVVPLSDGTRLGFGRDIGRHDEGESASQRIIEQYVERFARREDPATRLTARQCQVLQLVAEGRRTKEIASSLNISVKTVEAHRSQLMTALNIHDIPGLVRYAIRAGLISADD